MTISLEKGHVVSRLQQQPLHSGGEVTRVSERPETIFTDNITVTFEGMCFQFSGILAFGRREEAVVVVERLGGYTPSGSSLPGIVNYLVVGDLEKRAHWRKGYGGLITKAMRHNKKAPGQIQIIPEREFVNAVVRVLDRNGTRGTSPAAIKLTYRALSERAEKANKSRSTSAHFQQGQRW